MKQRGIELSCTKGMSKDLVSYIVSVRRILDWNIWVRRLFEGLADPQSLMLQLQMGFSNVL